MFGEPRHLCILNRCCGSRFEWRDSSRVKCAADPHALRELLLELLLSNFEPPQGERDPFPPWAKCPQTSPAAPPHKDLLKFFFIF